MMKISGQRERERGISVHTGRARESRASGGCAESDRDGSLRRRGSAGSTSDRAPSDVLSDQEADCHEGDCHEGEEPQPPQDERGGRMRARSGVRHLGARGWSARWGGWAAHSVPGSPERNRSRSHESRLRWLGRRLG